MSGWVERGERSVSGWEEGRGWEWVGVGGRRERGVSGGRREQGESGQEEGAGWEWVGGGSGV